MTKLSARALEYEYGATRMSGHFVSGLSKGGPRPGILIVHDAVGLGEHAIGCAERLASLGYAALAVDLWGNRAQITEMSKVMETIGQLTADRRDWMGRMEAARRIFAAQPEVEGHKLAAIGFCFGGTTVLEYARSGGEIRGAVSFHGGLDWVGREWDSQTAKAKLLICTGAEDPMVPASSVVDLQEALRKGKIDWQVDTYSDARHAFTRPNADQLGLPDTLAYNAQADRRSWAAMCDFFAEIFADS